MVRVPCMRDTGNFHGISIQDEKIIPKIAGLAITPIPAPPQRYELAISRIKRGGVEFIMAGHILQASLLWLVPLPPES